MIGDSWSVPNYHDPNGDPKETHIEFLLKNLGHTVHNCGMNGGSNFGTLDRAKVYLSGKGIGHPAHLPNQGMIRTDQEKIDLVIWFHTEPYRDIHLISPTNKTIDQQLHEICGIIYREYKDFLDSLNVNFHKISNMLSFAFIIPLLKPTYEMVMSGSLEGINLREFAVRIISYAGITISSILFKELFTKIVKRFREN